MEFNQYPSQYYDYNVNGNSSSLHWCSRCPSSTNWVSTSYPPPPHPFQLPHLWTPPPVPYPSFPPPVSEQSQQHEIIYAEFIDDATKMKVPVSVHLYSDMTADLVFDEMPHCHSMGFAAPTTNETPDTMEIEQFSCPENLSTESADISETIVISSKLNSDLDDDKTEVTDIVTVPLDLQPLITAVGHTKSEIEGHKALSIPSSIFTDLDISGVAYSEFDEMSHSCYSKDIADVPTNTHIAFDDEDEDSEYSKTIIDAKSGVEVQVLEYGARESEFDLAAGNSRTYVDHVFDNCSHRVEPTFIKKEVTESFVRSTEIRLLHKHVFIQLPFDPGESFPPPIQFKRSKIQLDKLLCLPVASFDVFNLAGPIKGGMSCGNFSQRATKVFQEFLLTIDDLWSTSLVLRLGNDSDLLEGNSCYVEVLLVRFLEDDFTRPLLDFYVKPLEALDPAILECYRDLCAISSFCYALKNLIVYLIRNESYSVINTGFNSQPVSMDAGLRLATGHDISIIFGLIHQVVFILDLEEHQKYVSHALGLQMSKIVCTNKRIGGGSGSTEISSALFVAATAISSYQLDHPIKIIRDYVINIMTAGCRSFLEKYKLDKKLFKASYILHEGDVATFLLSKSHERFTQMLLGPITVCANGKDVGKLFKGVTVLFDMSFQWILPIIAFGGIPTTEESYSTVKGILSSNGALALPEVPLQLVLINASYIGLQMRSFWGYRGSEMTVDEFAYAIFYLTARILNEVAALLGLINETWPISVAMLSQVAHDATNANKEPVRIGLFHYLGSLHRGIVRLLEIIHSILFAMLKMVEADTPRDTIVAYEKGVERKNVFVAMLDEMSIAGATCHVANVLLSVIKLARALSKIHADVRSRNSLSEGSTCKKLTSNLETILGGSLAFVTDYVAAEVLGCDLCILMNLLIIPHGSEDAFRNFSTAIFEGLTKSIETCLKPVVTIAILDLVMKDILAVLSIGERDVLATEKSQSVYIVSVEVHKATSSLPVPLFANLNLEDKVLFKDGRNVTNITKKVDPFEGMSNYIWDPGKITYI